MWIQCLVMLSEQHTVNFLWHDVKLNNLPEPHLSLQPSKRRDLLNTAGKNWACRLQFGLSQPGSRNKTKPRHLTMIASGIMVSMFLLTLLFCFRTWWMDIKHLITCCLSFAGEVLPFLSRRDTNRRVFHSPWWFNHSTCDFFKEAQNGLKTSHPTPTQEHPTALGISRISGIEFSILNCNFGFNTSQLARLPS